ncbi:Protein CBR-PTR-17 [Caenorhabditis briggsae]|uniref:Protein CBR-PTR-17 n=1 Tax=Caenorhabditis briggsae TaxID=6238 RepID=A8X5E1_CAEBR|nr:Protein CBR-PTR-17 [Caenorhabditis briggsae]CAP27852.2 Protein CBR-PTR-17 [Caenorhabditis briggsae]
MIFKFRAAPLEKPWSKIVAKYCLFVARHPWPFIIIPFIITICLSMGIILNFKIVRGVNYLYAPLNATWKSEEAVFGENWAKDDDHFYPGKDILRRQGIYLIVNAKDSGNILRENHAKDFLKILEWIGSVKLISSAGRIFTYKDVCLHFQNDCFSNTHAKLLADIYSKNHQNSMFNISFPIYRSTYATEPIDISKVLGNVSLDSNGHVESASAWMILYQLKAFGPANGQLSKDFEDGLAEKIQKGETPSELLNIYYFHSATFDEELEKENRRLTPKFSITFSVLIIFAILSTFTIKFVSFKTNQSVSNWPIIDWVLSKPLLGVCGVLVTLCAIISSTGLLMLMDVTFVDMCTVMPFLSLTIGIDDTFLMLAAWHETDRNLPYEKRIEKSMRHAAVSISITSLTDALAFIIGSIAPLPAVMYFCYYSSAAILFIFLYCLTMFVAFLALQGKREQELRHSVTGGKTRDLEDYESAASHELLFKMGSRITVKADEENNNNNNEKSSENAETASENEDVRMWYQKFFEDQYAPFVSDSKISILSFLFLDYKDYKNYKNYISSSSILSKRAPPLSFPRSPSKPISRGYKNYGHCCDEFSEFHKFRREISSTWCSEGRNSTQFWFFEMQTYLSQLGFGGDLNRTLNSDRKLSQTKKTFLMSNEKFGYDVLDSKKFRLSTRLKNVDNDEQISNCAKTMRLLTEKHQNYSMTTYSPLWNIADEYDIMWPQTLQDIYISIAVMIPVALLFIPQPLCSLIIGLNIASIAFGVIGTMSFLGVSLDATSMITVAMSVGFSVDFAAHVSYAYMTESRLPKNGKSPIFSRFSHTLGTVGWPVTQASVSVLLGVSSLYLVDSYVVQTCFRTVLLVILFGTTHALVFLPLLLMNCHRIYAFLSKNSDSENS